jgi:phage shock protein PspC (stress-responsive transcriptional regulator)
MSGTLFAACLKVVRNYEKAGKIMPLPFHSFTENLYFRPMNRLKNFIEWKAFGVCTAIGEKMGIATSRIRMWFMYISFLTLGSPIIVYMVLAFWMNIKRYILAARRNPVRYL